MKHRIVQAEGGEQGDPLMPLLFSLAVHDSLQEVKSLLDPRDVLLAFLDDVCVVSQDPDRVRDAYDLLATGCRHKLAFASTLGRHACGTEHLCAPTEWPSWDLLFGTRWASECWGLQWGRRHLCRKP